MFFKIILAILIIMAILSGLTKIMLKPQDAAFFGEYGFTHPTLIIYGFTQLLGGILLAFSSTRVFGALLVAITFLISVVVLVLAGNILLAMLTVIFVILLGFVVNKSLK